MATPAAIASNVNAVSGSAGLTVTNAVWVATALLHRLHPEREGFEPEEIVRLVMQERLTDGQEDSVWTHVRQHSVANKKPQPNTVCMLFDPSGGIRRLFRRGDFVHPGRNAMRTHPNWEDLPSRYRELRTWYEREWASSDAGHDPLLALAGTWDGEQADVYVANLRSGWTERP